MRITQVRNAELGTAAKAAYDNAVRLSLAGIEAVLVSIRYEAMVATRKAITAVERHEARKASAMVWGYTAAYEQKKGLTGPRTLPIPTGNPGLDVEVYDGCQLCPKSR